MMRFLVCALAAVAAPAGDDVLVQGVSLAKPDWFGAASFPVPERGSAGGSSHSGLRIQRVDDSDNYLVEGQWDGGYAFKLEWEPSVRVEARVRAAVVLDVEAGLFEYRYTLENGTSAQQIIAGFLVAFDAPVLSTGKPEPDWWSKQLPENVWKKRIWSWSDVNTPLRGIPPGQKNAGFLIRSRGLPRMVACHARGKSSGLVILSPDPASVGEVEMPGPLWDALPRGLLEDCVSGLTVGPGPAWDSPDLSVAEVLSRVRGDLEIAGKQHWIATKALGTRLANQLAQAREACLAGDTLRATEILEQVIKDAEQYATKPCQIAPEVHAIIRENAAWVIRRLQK